VTVEFHTILLQSGVFLKTILDKSGTGYFFERRLLRCDLHRKSVVPIVQNVPVVPVVEDVPEVIIFFGEKPTSSSCSASRRAARRAQDECFLSADDRQNPWSRAGFDIMTVFSILKEGPCSQAILSYRDYPLVDAGRAYLLFLKSSG
jgi:hypothetical protein